MWNKSKKLKLVTHHGSFHTDDVFAGAALALLLEKRGLPAQAGEKWALSRTRDEKEIENADYVFDVGGIHDPVRNRFDHHQPGGAGAREDGVPYSSFGLVWQKYGAELAGSARAAAVLDERLVEPVDAFDNGISLVEKKHKITPYLIQHMFLAMNITWQEDAAKTDAQYLRSVEIAREILKREIVHIADELLAEEKVLESYRSAPDKRLIILDGKYPYENILNKFPEPVYVVFQRRDADKFWEVEAVRDEAKSFVNRKNLPAAWAGLRGEELARVSGVPDAAFCHRGLFMALARSREGAITLAQKALEANV